ncbi:class I SAM-dependent methyltransferase [Mucilaginibacter koreensis]
MFIDVTGQAIHDFFTANRPAKLFINNKYGSKEEMPVSTYFRNEQDMPELELVALQHCKGHILDIGAGAGSHALILQQRGFDVVALDISPLSVKTMQDRGVNNAVCADIFSYENPPFDTLLLLMNGIGLSGTLDGLSSFLEHAKLLMNTDGQILLDSSDVSYLYGYQPKPKHKYYGEVDYQYIYKSRKTDWFTWLYIDSDTLTRIANVQGWQTEILFDDGYDQYLAKLTRI